MKKLLLSLVIAAALYCTGFTQSVTDAADKTNLYNTQVKIIRSAIIDDDFYIYISLPDDYKKSGKQYAVLYLFDGDVTFGMATSIARYLEFGNTIPELIIVGIGYGVMKESEGNMRRRDFTISSLRGRTGSGGAPLFREFIKEELIPFIDTTYRTATDNRTLYGYSLGGLFATYTLFTEPDIFNHYIIGSPHLYWDNFKIFEIQEEEFAKFDDLDASLFISVGSEESEEKYFGPIDEMVTIIEEKGFKSLKMETKVFDGGTHLICPPEALTYGLISVFGN
jgi:predicted alpha/beta superfamily hydrolase